MSDETRLTTAEPSDVLSALKRAASDTTDIDKMERLLAMHLKLAEKDAEREFNMAFLATQCEIDPIFKDSQGHNTKYAKLEKINELISPIMQSHGLAVSFGTDTPAEMVDGWVRITARLYHANGHSELRQYDVPIDGAGAKGSSNKSGAQAVGSTMTYARRYALAMIFNLSFTDDRNAAYRPEAMSAANVATIREACASISPDQESKIVKWAGVERLEDIPSNKFGQIMDALAKKEKAKT